MSVAVLGAGAFGTALAIALAQGGAQVTLWARDPDAVATMQTKRVNPRLPGTTLPDNVQVTGDLTQACTAETLLLAVPMQQMANLLPNVPTDRAQSLVACCKGIDLAQGKGPTALIAAIRPHARAAILTGPSFATDIARGLPTALTLACADAAKGEALQHQLSTASLRLYRSTDTIGAELGGALKNVIAIACGACIGSGLGDSARAALMTRGFAEMTRFAASLGARPETLMGLSGFGDLVLTCGSDQSRNFRFGLALGRQAEFDTSITVEGAATAQVVARMAEERDLDMPICTEVAHLITRKRSVTEALNALLSRPLKEE